MIFVSGSCEFDFDRKYNIIRITAKYISVSSSFEKIIFQLFIWGFDVIKLIRLLLFWFMHLWGWDLGNRGEGLWLCHGLTCGLRAVGPCQIYVCKKEYRSTNLYLSVFIEHKYSIRKHLTNSRQLCVL